MAVLHDGKSFLGERYAIAVAPGRLLTPSTRWPGSQPRVFGAGVSTKNDEATALLMDSFYQHWLRDRSDGRPISKAKALSLAQSDGRDATKTSHPYYWAAFTLLGDWR